MNRCILSLIGTLGLVLASAAADPPSLLQPKQSDIGKLPAGWQAARTGQGEGSTWQVVADATTPSKSGLALAQTAKGPKALFNLCVTDATNPRDLELSVAFKAMAGEIDQGGGPVWRYQDADNYYICRMNPLEKNFRVYKVIAGKRTQLATQEDIDIPAGEWHTVKIVQIGDQIECFLNGKKLLTAKDDAITKPGKVGLWTKADAQTRFDNVQVRELKK